MAGTQTGSRRNSFPDQTGFYVGQNSRWQSKLRGQFAFFGNIRVAGVPHLPRVISQRVSLLCDLPERRVNKRAGLTQFLQIVDFPKWLAMPCKKSLQSLLRRLLAMVPCIRRMVRRSQNAGGFEIVKRFLQPFAYLPFTHLIRIHKEPALRGQRSRGAMP